MNEISPAVEIVFFIVLQVPVEDRVQPFRDRSLRRRIGERNLAGQPDFIFYGVFPAPSSASYFIAEGSSDLSVEFFDVSSDTVPLYVEAGGPGERRFFHPIIVNRFLLPRKAASLPAR